jgi:hypothetical protein
MSYNEAVCPFAASMILLSLMRWPEIRTLTINLFSSLFYETTFYTRMAIIAAVGVAYQRNGSSEW